MQAGRQKGKLAGRLKEGKLAGRLKGGKKRDEYEFALRPRCFACLELEDFTLLCFDLLPLALRTLYLPLLCTTVKGVFSEVLIFSRWGYFVHFFVLKTQY